MILARRPITNVLPLELIEDTIDIVAADDRQTHPLTLPNVKACSLTCHTFLPRSRQHIFRSIKIHHAHRYIPRCPSDQTPSPLASSFAALLTSNPQIAALVRDLDYIFPEIGGSLPDVAPILQILVKLETFGLYSDNGGTLQWWGLNPRSRSIFIRLMHLPSITRLHLGSVTDFPASLFFPCVNLQSVCLDGLRFDEGELSMMPQPSISCNIRLRELDLRIGPSHNHTISKIAKKVTERGEPIFDLEGLKKLTATIRCPDQIELTSKALKHATNVESVHLLVKPSYKLGPDHLNALDRIISLLSPSLGTLKYLHFDLYIDSPKLAPLAEIPRALKGIAAEAKQVVCLKIRINVNEDVEYVYDVPQSGDECHWSLLEQVIVAPGHWPSLKVVNFEIIASSPMRYGDWERTFSDFVQARISDLSKKAVGIEVISTLPSILKGKLPRSA